MRKVSVLVIHNRYQQWGGEDAVVAAEVEDLQRRRHRVIQYTRNNAAIRRYGALRKASLPFGTIWNPWTFLEIRNLVKADRPDVAHIHNFFPLVSPAAHYACQSLGIPVVQTLHNYRLFCPAATLFTGERRCDDCSGGLSASTRRGCYRNSRLQTAVASAMLGSHRAVGTWEQSVDAFLVPSFFCREYFAGKGLPRQKLHVRPNFLTRDPGQRTMRDDYALFVGRLSAEKGALEMVRAWEQLSDIPLLLVGGGPQTVQLREQAKLCRGAVKLLGQLEPEQTISYVKRARFLVFPSRWYEPFGMGLLEAAACGVPAVASRIGAIPELVADNEIGLLFDPDNRDEFIERVRWAWSHPLEMEQMGAAARQLYLERFTADKSYESLNNVWRSLLN